MDAGSRPRIPEEGTMTHARIFRVISVRHLMVGFATLALLALGGCYVYPAGYHDGYHGWHHGYHHD
jgi:hypothetical protein